MCKIDEATILLLVCSTVAFAASGCGGARATDKAKSEEPPRLDQTHKGWKNPNCWECHDSEKAVLPHSCLVKCHAGANGALPRGKEHAESKSCSQKGCHSPLPPVHHADDETEHFPEPESCEVCHPQAPAAESTLSIATEPPLSSAMTFGIGKSPLFLCSS